jgi:hypothetical protein
MTPINSLDSLLTLIGTLGVLAFFLFTVKQDNVVMRSASYIGRVTMMLCFGAIFASGIMLRISLFIGILQFMFGKWILIIK